MNLLSLSFNVHFNSLHEFLVDNIPNSDGVVSTDTGFLIVEKVPFTETEISLINNYYNNLTEEAEANKFLLSTKEIIKKALIDAQKFGLEMIDIFKEKNVEMGISQLNLTKEVSDYCHWLNHYLEQGSLRAALKQIDIYLQDTDRGPVSQFITDERLNYYKARIQNYLGIIP